MSRKFELNTLDDLKSLAKSLNVNIPVCEDTTALFKPLTVEGKMIPNRIAFQAMEGCDGTADGKPGPLTRRRYLRFGAGGAGLLWIEATAVVPCARANPRQIWLHDETLDSFREMVNDTRKAAADHNGSDHNPYFVLQLTHSGRYSRPVKERAPIIAYNDPLLNKAIGLSDDYPAITDTELEKLEGDYVTAAKLAVKAGFDAVDIKACHRYLISELLGGFTRPGKYGGDFDGRTRFLRNIVEKVRDAIGDQIRIFVRLNCFDGHPRPYGWGVCADDPNTPDLTEVHQLIGILKNIGVSLVNVTAGNPYYTPHINRPYDKAVVNGYENPEHPLQGVARISGIVRDITKHFSNLPTISSGTTWLQHLLPYVAAGMVNDGWTSMVGSGRMSFAYPDWPRELKSNGKLDRKKVCITCSGCTQLMRDGGRAGCIIRDRDIYGEEYKAGRRRSRNAEG